MSDPIGIKLGVQGEKDFKKALTEINQSFKVLGSEMKLVASQFDKNDNSVEALTARNEVLNKQIDAQKDKIGVLKSALENAANSFGETDKRTQAWQIKLNNAEAALKEMSRQLNDNRIKVDSVNEANEHFKLSIDNIDKSFSVLASEMKLVESHFNKNDDSVESLTAKNEVLSKQISNQAEKVSYLKKALDNAASSFGENDDRTKEWQIQLNNAEAALNGMERELIGNKAKMDEVASSADNMGDEVKNSGKQADDSEASFQKLGTTLKTVGAAMTAAVAAIGAAAVTAGKKLWDMSNEVAQAGDEIDKESQKLGLSAESYQKLSYAMERSGADVDDFKKGTVNISKALADVQNNVDGAGATFGKLGVALKNSDGSMRSTEQVLLDSIDALASMKDETQRNALANSIFGKSYTELAPLLNTGADGIQALMKEAENYGMVMSDDAVAASAAFEDSLTKLKGTISGVKNNMVGELLPGITQITDGLSNLVAGNRGAGKEIENGVKSVIETISGMIPQVTQLLTSVASAVLQGAPSIVNALIDGITQALPELTPVVVNAVKSIGQTIIDNAPTILKSVLDMAKSLITSIIPELPDLMTSLVEGLVEVFGEIFSADNLEDFTTILLDLIQNLVDGLQDALPILIDGVFNLISGLVEALPDIFTQILDALPTLIDSISSMIQENLPKIIEGVISLISGLAEALPTLLDSLIAKLPEIITSLVDLIVDNLPILIDGVIKLVEGLVNSMDTIMMALLEKTPDIIGSIIDALMDNLPKLIEGAINLVVELAKHIPEIIWGFIQKIPDIITSIINAFGGIFEKMKEIGGNMLKGLWEGIQNVGKWLWEKISGFFSGIFDGIKSFFGIKSPSKLFRDQIGKNLALGIGEGFTDEMDTVSDEMKNAIPTDFDAQIQATADFATNGSALTSPTASNAQYNQTFNVTVSVGSISDQYDVNDLATLLSERLADEVRTKEGVYA